MSFSEAELQPRLEQISTTAVNAEEEFAEEQNQFFFEFHAASTNVEYMIDAKADTDLVAIDMSLHNLDDLVPSQNPRLCGELSDMKNMWDRMKRHMEHAQNEIQKTGRVLQKLKDDFGQFDTPDFKLDT